MNFGSIEYFLFVPLLFLCLLMVPRRFCWLVFLVGSWYFYLALQYPSLLLILLLVTIFTYLCGLLLDWCRHGGGRLCIFWGGVAANLMVLIAMKYLPFLSHNLNVLFKNLSIGPIFQDASPLVAIGVSYFVFQALSYLIDVFLGVVTPERHAGIFALYLGFFPKLLQGPIERAGDLIPQLRVPFCFNQENVRAGLLMFVWGLFKKTVVADRLAVYVNDAYGSPAAHAGLPLLLATYLFALQIYYDFAGYTDMALGSARMFNISLSRNFNTPYLATSVADFWRRWHISFSRWILDYLFKPLQLLWRDWQQAGTAAALVVTFLVSGFWHGASWGFVAWGGLHGVYLASSVYYKPLQRKLHLRLGLKKGRWLRFWQTVTTFHMICFAWIFFRASSISDAWYIITHLAGGGNSVRDFLLSHGVASLVIAVGSLLLVWTVYWTRENILLGKDFFTVPGWIRWSAYGMLAAVLLLFNNGSNAGFIYFKF